MTGYSRTPLAAIAGMLAVVAASLMPAAVRAQTPQAAYQQALQQAQAARQQAAAVHNRWTTTAKVLEQARKAAAEGDYARARALADQATALARLAVDQARRQQQLWRAAVIRQ